MLGFVSLQQLLAFALQMHGKGSDMHLIKKLQSTMLPIGLPLTL
jgi:hypothetical protein